MGLLGLRLFVNLYLNREIDAMSFFLNGDLSQMGNQRSFLIKNGFVLMQTKVYTTVKDTDKKKALTIFWINKVDGWWNYH